MKVKGDDDHRKAFSLSAGEGRDKMQTPLNHTRILGRGERKGGVKCVVRKMLLVLVLTEKRSTIEYYVFKYTAGFFGGVVFW